MQEKTGIVGRTYRKIKDENENYNASMSRLSEETRELGWLVGSWWCNGKDVTPKRLQVRPLLHFVIRQRLRVGHVS